MKEQYKYEHQLAILLHKNYGISLEDFTKLVHDTYDGAVFPDIKAVYDRISANKIYRVVNTDNYGGDYPDESFITMTDSEGNTHPLDFSTKEDANVIANAFNQIKYRGHDRFFIVVEKNYKLQGRFEP